ncbi:MAG: thymidine phosphorylase [Candidatus Hodarchaeales archaeon]
MPQLEVLKISLDPKDTGIVSKSSNKQLFAKAKYSVSFQQKKIFLNQLIKVEGLIEGKQIGLSSSIMKKLGVKEGELVELESVGKHASQSYRLVKNHILQPGHIFTKADIDQIISDITNDVMTPLETSVFITSMQFQPWNISEVEYLTRAIADSGQKIKWNDGVIFDKHSLGGVPGNKVSLLIVPIIAAAGMMIPKTSSRAITSPSGTADTMEALGADIEFSIEEIVNIVNKTHGLIAWTGGLNIVPADEKIIREVQFPLSLDPEPMLMASVLSKKVAMGVKFLVLDIPTGVGTKVANMEIGKRIAHRFTELGHALGIRIESGLTYGSSPVGHAIGPALEAREALKALKDPQHASDSLIGKSTSLAGILLEMAGKALQGRGQDLAMDILYSGRAYKKFQEILEAQNADPNIKEEDIEIGSCVYEYLAPQNGYIVELNNKVLVRAAKAAGAPMDKRAGIHFLRKKDSVKRGEVVFRLYASNDKKLRAAEAELARGIPLTIEGMLLARE